jgi:hypothetical protein
MNKGTTIELELNWTGMRSVKSNPLRNPKTHWFLFVSRNASSWLHW